MNLVQLDIANREPVDLTPFMEKLDEIARAKEVDEERVESFRELITPAKVLGDVALQISRADEGVRERIRMLEHGRRPRPERVLMATAWRNALQILWGELSRQQQAAAARLFGEAA